MDAGICTFVCLGFAPLFVWDELFAWHDDVGTMTPEGDAFDILGEQRVSK